MLLIPGRGWKDDVGEERVGGHPEIDGGEQVELRFRRLPPGDVARPVLGGGLLGAHAGLGRAQHVLEEVLVALAGRAQQVRPPHRHHPRMVLLGVRILAGEPKPAFAQLGDDELGRVDSRPLGVVDQVEGVAVEAGERRQPAQPGAEGVHVGDVHALERARPSGEASRSGNTSA